MNPFAYGPKSPPEDVPIELLDTFVEFCRTEDPERRLHGTMMIRKLLSVDEYDPPRDQVIATKIPEQWVELLLSEGEDPTVQFEAAWALTNIASGDSEHSQYIFELKGAVEGFVKLVTSGNADCREQAIWGVGNLVGEGAAHRDHFLSLGIAPRLCAILEEENQPLGIVRNIAWCFGNLCRGRPYVDLQLILECIPKICYLLSHEDEEVVQDAAWGIAYIVEGGGIERLNKILSFNPLKRLVELCADTNRNRSIINPALRALAGFTAGPDATTQLVLDTPGFLQVMPSLLSNRHRGIRKEACWCLSNIFAGSKTQIDMCIRGSSGVDLVPLVLDLMFATEHEVKKEAIWAVCNFCAGASAEQVDHLVTIGGFAKAVDLLKTLADSRLLALLLEVIESILAAAEKRTIAKDLEHNDLAVEMCQNGGLTAVNRLILHGNTDVSDRATTILERYFDELEDEGDLLEQPN